MIRHIPEGIVPFDDCGYSRKPLYPFIGQEIMLECLCNGGTPLLEIRGIDCRVPPASSCGENHWRFVLSPFASACTFQYRFLCDQEKTSWFTVDVLRMESVSSLVEAGAGWVKLTERVFLNFTCTDSFFSTVLTDHPVENHAFLPAPWHLSLGQEDIWRLFYQKELRAACKKINLGFRADGTVAWQQMIIHGTQQHIWGTGERFDSVNQIQKSSCGQVVEHFTRQGPWTYLPVPMFLTDAGFGFYRNTACNVSMCFDKEIRIASLMIPGRSDAWLLGSPAEQLNAYIHLTGDPVLPPEWAFGLWISANGWSCDADVEEQLEELKKNRCPASVMVLEAWSDESTFYRWSDSWNSPEQLVKKIRDAGLHLVLWQIPVIKAIRDCPDQEAVCLDRAVALSKGWVVRHTDGTPYVIPERWFEGSLLPDFTNPEACSWWFSKREHLLHAGVEGFKTDGGEFLFGSDMLLSDGTCGWEAHNAYPMQYTRAYHAWMQRQGVQGLTFSRAGYSGAQTVPIHWAGDQLSNWEELKAQLHAGLSAGLSGVLFWGFDIGGFAGELPDAELYLRATAFACFCPVMQWHAEPRSGQFYATHDQAFNNDRSPWNLAQKLGQPEIVEIACGFARVREQLRPYLWEEAQFCVQHARPLMAPLCLDYPEDPKALDCGDEYMLGRRYLVAPITEKGAAGRMVYFPKGKWQHYFTKEIMYGNTAQYMTCPLTEALVYEKMEE